MRPSIADVIKLDCWCFASTFTQMIDFDGISATLWAWKKYVKKRWSLQTQLFKWLEKWINNKTRVFCCKEKKTLWHTHMMIYDQNWQQKNTKAKYFMYHLQFILFKIQHRSYDKTKLRNPFIKSTPAHTESIVLSSIFSFYPSMH